MTRAYSLVFSANTATYACHAGNCRHAQGNERRGLYWIECASWDTVADARAWADADESAKAGKPVRARWKCCPCTKGAGARGRAPLGITLEGE